MPQADVLLLSSSGADATGSVFHSPRAARRRFSARWGNHTQTVAAAGFAGIASSGHGVWAAESIAMVATRDSSVTGSSFRAAALRLQGTILGAMFAFFLLNLAVGGPATLGARRVPASTLCLTLPCWRLSGPELGRS